MPRTTLSCRSANPQRGVASLFVVSVLLLGVGLIALYSNRSAIMEQRMSANEVRAKQAFAAASAGLEHALAYLRSGTGGMDQNSDGVVDTITSDTLTNGSGQASYYKAIFCEGTNALPACPASHTGTLTCTAPASNLTLVAVSCGWSDDDASVQRVVQGMQPSTSLGGQVSTPLITRTTANLLTGGATIMNYFNDLTVWSGGSLLSQSNTGKTFIRDISTNATALDTDPYRNTGNSPACNNPPAGYTCSTQGSTLGHDVVFADTNLSSMSPTDFFQFFFHETMAAYRDGTADWRVDPTGGLPNTNSTSISSILGKTATTIWVEGNTTLPSGTPTLGTQDKPIVLIVNGDLDLSSFNGEINGLVYVQGNITGNGSPTIYGALIGANTANASGNLKVVYDPKALAAAQHVGLAAKVAGSWRDW